MVPFFKEQKNIIRCILVWFKPIKFHQTNEAQPSMALSFASGFWQLTVPMSKGIDLDIK